MTKIKDSNKNKVPDVIEETKVVRSFMGLSRTTQIVIAVAVVVGVALLVARYT